MLSVIVSRTFKRLVWENDPALKYLALIMLGSAPIYVGLIAISYMIHRTPAPFLWFYTAVHSLWGFACMFTAIMATYGDPKNRGWHALGDNLMIAFMAIPAFALFASGYIMSWHSMSYELFVGYAFMASIWTSLFYAFWRRRHPWIYPVVQR